MTWLWAPHWRPHSQKQLREQSCGGLGAAWGWGGLRGFESLCMRGNELHA